MISTIEQLKLEIIKKGVAKEQDLVGCHERDLEIIEKKYGELPLYYKQIMRLLGRSGGRWLTANECNFTIHRANELNLWMREDECLINNQLNQYTIEELKHVFFILGDYAEYAGSIEFIKINQPIDSPVYSIDMAYYGNVDEWIHTIEIDHKSIWDWIGFLIDRAQDRMLAAESKNNTSSW
jgi:hypothetical protein